MAHEIESMFFIGEPSRLLVGSVFRLDLETTPSPEHQTMNNVIQFQSKPVQLLWSPKRGVRSAWRLLSANGQLVPFAPIEAPIGVKHETIEAPKYTDAEIAKFRRLRDAIDAETEALDKDWCQGPFDDYTGCLDDDDARMIDEFRENYSSNGIGCIDFDDLTGKEIANAVPADTLAKKIFEHSKLQPCDDIYTQWNEMGSVGVGEYEYQIDVCECAEIATVLADMTDDELTRFRERYYVRVDRDSFCAYGRPCERLVLKLDAAAFLADEVIRASLTSTYPESMEGAAKV